MKKIKSKKSNLKNKIKDTWNDFVHNPFGVFIEFLRGIKLYLSTDNPYQREKISSNDVGIWTNLEIYSIIKM